MPRRLWLLALVVLILLMLAGLWQWLAVQEAVDAELLRRTLDRVTRLRDHGLTVPLLLLLFVLGSLVVFPLSMLVAVTGLIFGPFWGFLIAFSGTMLASVATFWVGHFLGREAVSRLGGHWIGRLSDALGRRGVTTMVTVSLLPLAPFGITNLVAGAFGLRFRDYLLGSAVGIAPGLLAVTVVGSELATLIRAEDLDAVFWAVGVMAVAIGAAALLRRRYAASLAGPD